MKQFDIPPVLPLLGSTLGNYLRIVGSGRIEPRYYLKILLTGFVILVATPFQVLDYLWFRKRLMNYRFEKEPLFIIGHWRSGTTLLHNCLCQDETSGYLTTYHSLFPNNLKSKFLFRTFVRIGMPEKRPSDNMILNTSYPQEEEFALGNTCPDFYYKFFYFPERYGKFYDRTVSMNMPKSGKDAWKNAYIRLLKKAMINTNGERIIVKNPANTARVRTILEMFPNAKFLFLYRNPLKVFLSTQRFFYMLMPTIWLHHVDKKFINQIILDTYKNMLDDYNGQKHLIPAGNLMEIRFEDFEANPAGTLDSIYTNLLNEDFDKVRGKMIQYLDSLKSYRKNTYSVPRNTIRSVSQHWRKYIRKWNYHVPEDIKVS